MQSHIPIGSIHTPNVPISEYFISVILNSELQLEIKSSQILHTENCVWNDSSGRKQISLNWFAKSKSLPKTSTEKLKIRNESDYTVINFSKKCYIMV